MQRQNRNLQDQQYEQNMKSESLILSSKDDRDFQSWVEFTEEDEIILSSKNDRASSEDDNSMRAFSFGCRCCEQYDNMPLLHSCQSFEDWKQSYGNSVLRQLSGENQLEVQQGIQNEEIRLTNRNISLCFSELLQMKDAEMMSSFSQRNDLNENKKKSVKKLSCNPEDTVEILTDGLLNNWERQWTGKDHFMEHVEAVAERIQENEEEKLYGANTI